MKNDMNVVSVVKFKDCKYSIINGILRKAINTYGERNQEEMAIEEMSELIQAISHKHRGREHNIAEEIADVEIMLEQLKMINNCSDEVETICNQKIKRLAERLKGGK